MPTFRRDYPAMVSALQSLGYSVPGFVATALATLDGQPIAQVAVGELDISGLCKHFSRMLRSALLVLDAALWGAFQQQVIVSTDRAIILKSMGEDHQVFLILVTTSTTKTSEALDAIEKIGGTLKKAL
jgi:predicted regulator of Ras-like GTPase activity (Roadblock/LC7/MglB family)